MSSAYAAARQRGLPRAVEVGGDPAWEAVEEKADELTSLDCECELIAKECNR